VLGSAVGSTWRSLDLIRFDACNEPLPKAGLALEQGEKFRTQPFATLRCEGMKRKQGQHVRLLRGGVRIKLLKEARSHTPFLAMQIA
jgi:hypothetical protein